MNEEIARKALRAWEKFVKTKILPSWESAGNCWADMQEPIRLTKEALKDEDPGRENLEMYLKNFGQICPKCLGRRLVEMPPETNASGGIKVKVMCQECGYEWVDVYERELVLNQEGHILFDATVVMDNLAEAMRRALGSTESDIPAEIGNACTEALEAFDRIFPKDTAGSVKGGPKS